MLGVGGSSELDRTLHYSSMFVKGIWFVARIYILVVSLLARSDKHLHVLHFSLQLQLSNRPLWYWPLMQDTDGARKRDVLRRAMAYQPVSVEQRFTRRYYHNLKTFVGA